MTVSLMNFLSVTEIGQFGKIARGVIELVDELAKEVDTEKMEVSSTMDELLFNSPQMLLSILYSICLLFAHYSKSIHPVFFFSRR